MQEDSAKIATTRADLGRGIKRLRDSKGWTQAELARKLGTSQSTVSKIIAGTSFPRPALKARIEVELKKVPARAVSDEWLAVVAEAAGRSPLFFDVVNAALQLLNENE
ncbi:helix-turn-helix domain-containing protein [Rhizobium sp. IY2]|uniref:helix-turn-helix domain-containing protein n=1 Tax=Rhizobium sp. IY2 TaxID=3397853 RepID=UPI0039DF5170